MVVTRVSEGAREGRRALLAAAPTPARRPSLPPTPPPTPAPAAPRTSRRCSCSERSGLAAGGAARSYILMLPSPQAPIRMASLPSDQARSYMPSAVSNAAASTSPPGVAWRHVCGERGACAVGHVQPPIADDPKVLGGRHSTPNITPLNPPPPPLSPPTSSTCSRPLPMIPKFWAVATASRPSTKGLNLTL
jgi:hypothetical protein